MGGCGAETFRVGVAVGPDGIHGFIIPELLKPALYFVVSQVLGVTVLVHAKPIFIIGDIRP